MRGIFWACPQSPLQKCMPALMFQPSKVNQTAPFKKILMRKNPNFPDPTNKVIKYNYSTFPRNNQSLPPPPPPPPPPDLYHGRLRKIWLGWQAWVPAGSRGKEQALVPPLENLKNLVVFLAHPTQFLRKQFLHGGKSKKCPPCIQKGPHIEKKKQKVPQIAGACPEGVP